MRVVGKKRIVVQAKEVWYEDGKQKIGKSKSVTVHDTLNNVWKNILYDGIADDKDE